MSQKNRQNDQQKNQTQNQNQQQNITEKIKITNQNKKIKKVRPGAELPVPGRIFLS